MTGDENLRSPLQPATFTITRIQIDRLEEESQRTGLPKSELVRRALDEYNDAQDLKIQRQILTREQRQNVKEASRLTGDSEIQIVRKAVDKATLFVVKRRRIIG